MKDVKMPTSDDLVRVSSKIERLKDSNYSAA
jgi:hypothetical protein